MNLDFAHSGDWIGGGLLLAAFSIVATWWGRAKSREPDPPRAMDPVHRGAWRVAPLGILAGVAIVVLGALARC